MKNYLVIFSILIVTAMAYTDMRDRLHELNVIADQTEVQKNIKPAPSTSGGTGINDKIDNAIAQPLQRNIQNSGQNMTQGPAGFKENRINPQTNPENPLNIPQELNRSTGFSTD